MIVRTLRWMFPDNWVSILTLVLACIFFGTSISSAQVPENSPTTQYWVTDQANILSASINKRLTTAAKTHEKLTTNQLVVVTVNSLEGMSIEAYGLWLANKWGIGQADKNNGVLLLVAPNERKVRIEVGKGLENLLTNSIAQTIIDREILPNFKNRLMEKGISSGHRAIIQALNGDYEPSRKPQSVSSRDGSSNNSTWKTILQIILTPLFFLGRLLGLGGDSSGGSWGGGGFSGGGGGFGGGGASGGW